MIKEERTKGRGKGSEGGKWEERIARGGKGGRGKGVTKRSFPDDATYATVGGCVFFFLLMLLE